MVEAQRTQQPDASIPKGVSLSAYFEAGDRNLNVEVVNGELVMTAAHQRGHSLVARNLFRSLDAFVLKQKLGEVWEESPYVLDGDKSSDWVSRVRVPDVSFVARPRVDAHNAEHGKVDGPWWLVPDLAVEIISPTDRYKEVDDKIAEYLRFGVPLVWLINPHALTVRVCTPANPAGVLLDDKTTLGGEPVLPGWSMPIKDIFAD